jgi:hypothetical protein
VAASPTGDSSDRSALIAATVTAVLLTAYAAWVLYAPLTREMLLPPIFGVGFIFVWVRRKSAFYRRAVGILLGLATAGAAVPAVGAVAEASGFRIDARLSGSSGGFSIVCVIGAFLFGSLEYLDRTAGTSNSRFDSRSILLITLIIIGGALLAGAAWFALAAPPTAG